MESGVFPVFEAEHAARLPACSNSPSGAGGRLFAASKRFAHLFGKHPDVATLARLQGRADRNIRRFGLLETN